MAVDFAALVDDLAAEEDELAALLEHLDDAGWRSATPAEGWTVLDQVAHLAEGEELAALALADPGAFADRLGELLTDLDATRAAMAAAARELSPTDALETWQGCRRATLGELRRVGADARVLWITGAMSSSSFTTARLMETWAHGQDILDGLGIDRPPTARLRHIAHLGVSTREFSFRNRGVEPPAALVRVELEAPDGGSWRWGPPDAPERVRGTALDFCLVVTQRRHVDDTELVAQGDGARRWLTIAQAFAGPPTDGRPPTR